MAASSRALGNRDEALKVFKALDEALPRHPLVMEALRDLEAGRRVAPLVDTAQAGAAEALYTIGAALGRRGEDVGLVYLQLALYLKPNHALALTSLADIYEGMRKPELAIKTYERVASASPLSHNARIQRALNLDQVERSDEAIADLERIVEADASDREAIMALGNILRARKKFAECANVYSQGGRRHRQGAEDRLAGLLFPRHLLRAIQAVAEGRSRHEDGARALARPAARAQLSRLFVGRPGRPSR